MKETKHIQLYENFKTYLNFLGYTKIKDFGEVENYEGPKNETYSEIWTNHEINHSIQLIKKRFPNTRFISEFIFINGNESTFLKTVDEQNTFIEDHVQNHINYPDFISIYQMFDSIDKNHKFVKLIVITLKNFLEFINKNIILLLTEQYLIQILDTKNLTYVNIGIVELFKMLDPSLKAINNIFKNVLNSELSENDKSNILNVARKYDLSILKDFDIDYISIDDDESELF